MDVPVIAAAWFKGDVADDYALERQYVQIASSNKILGKSRCFSLLRAKITELDKPCFIWQTSQCSLIAPTVYTGVYSKSSVFLKYPKKEIDNSLNSDYTKKV